MTSTLLPALFQPFEADNVHVTIAALEKVVDYIRPKRSRDVTSVNTSLASVVTFLERQETAALALRRSLGNLLTEYDLHYFFTEYTALQDSAFLGQFRKRLLRKLMPELPKKKTLAQLLRRVFRNKRDHEWLANVNPGLWHRLLLVLDFQAAFSRSPPVRRALLESAKLLSFRIATFGLDEQIRIKYSLLDEDTKVFFDQTRALTVIYDLFENSSDTHETTSRIQEAVGLLHNCQHKISLLRSRKREIGTSIELTFLSRQVKNHIDRLILLLNIFMAKDSALLSRQVQILLQESVEYQTKKNSIANLVQEYLDLVTLQIVEHTAQHGGKYIAETRSAYWRFLRAAMVGGFIIAIFAMFKIWLEKTNLPPFVEAVMFSINYAACFILVKSLGGIIATKQPAMTASSIIKNITPGERDEDKLQQLTTMLINVHRSQFISFVGNLIVAFPIAMIISYAIDSWTTLEFITPGKANRLLVDLKPIEGGALLYAAMAGVFLSVAGLISGYFDNKVIYSNVAARVRNVRLLQALLGATLLAKFATHIEKNLGSVMGNICLGFFLGMAGFVGYITGLPIDIRHIAFSSANFGFVFDPSMAFDIVCISSLGIFLIGLINFLVSFGLTLLIALKARQVTLGQSRILVKLVVKALVRNPLVFCLPVNMPKNDQKETS